MLNFQEYLGARLALCGTWEWNVMIHLRSYNILSHLSSVSLKRLTEEIHCGYWVQIPVLRVFECSPSVFSWLYVNFCSFISFSLCQVTWRTNLRNIDIIHKWLLFSYKACIYYLLGDNGNVTLQRMHTVKQREQLLGAGWLVSALQT